MPKSASEPKSPNVKSVFDEYLNPKSAVAPGIAGAVVMLLANTLWVQFGVSAKWSALVISVGFAAMVTLRMKLKNWERVILVPLNSLFVFSVAVAANTIGPKVNRDNESDLSRHSVEIAKNMETRSKDLETSHRYQEDQFLRIISQLLSSNLDTLRLTNSPAQLLLTNYALSLSNMNSFLEIQNYLKNAATHHSGRRAIGDLGTMKPRAFFHDWWE